MSLVASIVATSPPKRKWWSNLERLVPHSSMSACTFKGCDCDCHKEKDHWCNDSCPCKMNKPPTTEKVNNTAERHRLRNILRQPPKEATIPSLSSSHEGDTSDWIKEGRKNLLEFYKKYPHEGSVYNIIDSAYLAGLEAGYLEALHDTQNGKAARTAALEGSKKDS